LPQNPEKGGVGEKIKQYVGQGGFTEKGYIYRQAHENGVGGSATGGQEAGSGSLDLKQSGQEKNQAEIQQNGNKGEYGPGDDPGEFFAAESGENIDEKISRQGHQSHQPGQEDLGFRAAPAAAI